MGPQQLLCCRLTGELGIQHLCDVRQSCTCATAVQGTERANCPAALLQVSQEKPWKWDDPKRDKPGSACPGTRLSCWALAAIRHDMPVGYLVSVAGTNLSGNRDCPPGWFFFFTRDFIRHCSESWRAPKYLLLSKSCNPNYRTSCDNKANCGRAVAWYYLRMDKIWWVPEHSLKTPQFKKNQQEVVFLLFKDALSVLTLGSVNQHGFRFCMHAYHFS